MHPSRTLPPLPFLMPFPIKFLAGHSQYQCFLHLFVENKNLRDITRFFRVSVWLRLNGRLFWQIVSHNLRRVLFLHIAKNNKHNALLPLLLQMPHLIYGRSSDCLASWFYFISFRFIFCLLFIDSFCCTANVMRAQCLQTVFTNICVCAMCACVNFRC